MITFETQRENMVESQVRPSGITDGRVIRAMKAVPREVFVPEPLRNRAYADQDIILPNNRTLMAPRLLARLIQNLNLEADALVLDVGCTTGYATAVLSKIAQTVVGLESDEALAAEATEHLSAIGIDNAVIVTGPLENGYPDEGPYDAILVSGMLAHAPEDILDQLKDEGRLITVMMSPGQLGDVVVWRRLRETFDQRRLFEASTGLLPGFEPKEVFTF